MNRSEEQSVPRVTQASVNGGCGSGETPSEGTLKPLLKDEGKQAQAGQAPSPVNKNRKILWAPLLPAA